MLTGIGLLEVLSTKIPGAQANEVNAYTLRTICATPAQSVRDGSCTACATGSAQSAQCTEEDKIEAAAAAVSKLSDSDRLQEIAGGLGWDQETATQEWKQFEKWTAKYGLTPTIELFEKSHIPNIKAPAKAQINSPRVMTTPVWWAGFLAAEYPDKVGYPYERARKLLPGLVLEGAQWAQSHKAAGGVRSDLFCLKSQEKHTTHSSFFGSFPRAKKSRVSETVVEM